MTRRLARLLVWPLLLSTWPLVPGRAAPPNVMLPSGIVLEDVTAAEPGAAKIVLIAGSNRVKPGEHDYLNGCIVLWKLLRQTPGVAPVLAVDWPEKPETLAGARAIVMLFDGGDKHALLKQDRLMQIQKLSDEGVGLVQLHQVADYPKAAGERVRGLVGGAWEKGYSKRAHWVADFREFPDHPVFHGVVPFKVDDGWLTHLRFTPEKTGVTPLLRTVAPTDSKTKVTDDGAVVAWLYERPGGGRAFTFTGGHLHQSFAEAGYRRFLVNGVLWTAGLKVPDAGAPVALEPNALEVTLKEGSN